MLKVKPNKKYRQILVYLSVFFFLVFFIIILSSFKPSDNHSFSRFIPDTEDTIFLYDTVYYYDTTYVYDTVYLSKSFLDTNSLRNNNLKFDKVFLRNPKLTSLLLKNNSLVSTGKYLFSIDFLFSPMYSFHSFKSDFLYKEFALLNKNSITEDLSASFGLGLNFHRPFVNLSSGLYFTKYRENFNYLETDYLIDTILGYKYFTTTEIKIDTIEFFNIDSLLIGDTVIEYYYDTTRITSLDSNLVPKIDSTEYKINEKSKNSYSYFEIPLIVSLKFYRSNYIISPQFGIISSFFVDSKGKIVSLANINQSAGLKDESKFAFVNLSLYGSLNLTYFLSRRFDFFTTAYFRKNIQSVYRDYPIISRFNTYGINFGLRYKIAF